VAAKKHKFDVSIMERLKIAYENLQFSAGFGLQKNFRNNPDILSFPSRLFYGGKLKSGKEMKNSLYAKWNELSKGFPVLFVNTKGSTKKYPGFPSFYNEYETQQVVEKVLGLLKQFRDTGELEEKDICVLAGFKGQIGLLRERLRAKKIFGVNVDGVRNIQGKEYRIVILSIVRSGANPETLAQDNKFNLGFIRSAKAINTAMTRATELLIVIGNSDTMVLDEKWKLFIDYCHEQDSIIGATPATYSGWDTESPKTPEKKQENDAQDSSPQQSAAVPYPFNQNNASQPLQQQQNTAQQSTQSQSKAQENQSSKSRQFYSANENQAPVKPEQNIPPQIFQLPLPNQSTQPQPQPQFQQNQNQSKKILPNSEYLE